MTRNSYVKFSGVMLMDHYNILTTKLPDEPVNFFNYLIAFDWMILQIWTGIALSLLLLCLFSTFIKFLANSDRWKKRKARQGRSNSLPALFNENNGFLSCAPQSGYPITIRRTSLNVCSQKLTLDIPSVPDTSDAKRNVLNTTIQWWNNYWLFHRILFYQSAPSIPDFAPSRFLIIVWWLVVITLGGCFSGNILVSLLKDQPSKQIDTLNDLANRPSMAVFTEKHGLVRHLIEDDVSGKVVDTVLSSQLRDILKPIDEKHMMTPENIEVILSGKAALIASSFTIDSVAAFKGQCFFHIGSEKLFPSPLSLAMRDDFPQDFLAAINERIVSLTRIGLLKTWFKSSELKTSLCNAILEKEKAFRPLNWSDVKGIIILLTFGTISSCIALTLELITSEDPGQLLLPFFEDVKQSVTDSRQKLSNVGATVYSILTFNYKRRRSSNFQIDPGNVVGFPEKQRLSHNNNPLWDITSSSHSMQYRRQSSVSLDDPVMQSYYRSVRRSVRHRSSKRSLRSERRSSIWSQATIHPSHSYGALEESILDNHQELSVFHTVEEQS